MTKLEKWMNQINADLIGAGTAPRSSASYLSRELYQALRIIERMREALLEYAQDYGVAYDCFKKIEEEI